MSRFLCYLRHDWMKWSDPVAWADQTIKQGRLCRRCGKWETRRIVDSAQFLAELRGTK